MGLIKLCYLKNVDWSDCMTEKEALLELRSELSYKTKGNHSWSFSDEELDRLLSAKPKSLDELGKLKGFPRDGKRVNAFGQQIVDIFLGKNIKSFDVKVEGDDVKARTVLSESHSFTK